MRLSCVSLVILLVASVVACFGQSAVPVRHAAGGPVLSVEDVIKLAKAGVGEDIIVQQIKKRNRPFELSTDQLISLKAASVSDRIVAFMLDPSKSDLASVPAEPSAAAPPARAAEPEAALPTEVGVYVKQKAQWVEIAPEIVYWKSGGALKTIATAGILRGDVNGRVLGVSSHTVFSTPLEFLVIAPEGTALAEYQLIRMRPNKDSRGFRTVTGGVFHAQSGSFRDIVSFDSKKLAPRAYQVTFPSSAGAGEYGILPPTSNSGSGKIYSFRTAGPGAN